MSLNCGIVGLPNVGKSTLFSLLTSSEVDVANYPFCTIEPNVGVVSVPDERLEKLSSLIPTKRVVPAVTEFVDIAGLVKGASKGEGLGNQFLSSIRNVGIIAHVVRCFDDKDIVHTSGKIDPEDDIKTINLELILSDLDIVQKRLDKEVKQSRLIKEKSTSINTLEKAKQMLENEQPIRSANWSDEELKVLSSLCLITLKKVIYVCNVDENSIEGGNKYSDIVKKIAEKENADVVVLSAKIESEISLLPTDEEKQEMRQALGITTSSLSEFIKKAYHTLGLRTFFTAGSDEDRAWTFKDGMSAPECAGIIHTDFQKGFIKAEVYSFDDLEQHKREAELKKRGLIRLEGKEYLMKDGDVVFFKFNT